MSTQIHSIMAEAESLSRDFYADRIEMERIEKVYSAPHPPPVAPADMAAMARSQKRVLTRMAGYAMLSATMLTKELEGSE